MPAQNTSTRNDELPSTWLDTIAPTVITTWPQTEPVRVNSTTLAHSLPTSPSTFFDLNSTIPSELMTLMVNSENPTPPASPTAQSMSQSTESRLRLYDFRRHQGYPPRMPLIPGIPSGFRNPIFAPTPSTIAVVTEGHMYNPGGQNSIFVSSNPGASNIQTQVGLVGGIIMDEEPSISGSSNTATRRYNITRVERKSNPVFCSFK